MQLVPSPPSSRRLDRRSTPPPPSLGCLLSGSNNFCTCRALSGRSSSRTSPGTPPKAFGHKTDFVARDSSQLAAGRPYGFARNCLSLLLVCMIGRGGAARDRSGFFLRCCLLLVRFFVRLFSRRVLLAHTRSVVQAFFDYYLLVS